MSRKLADFWLDNDSQSAFCAMLKVQWRCMARSFLAGLGHYAVLLTPWSRWPARLGADQEQGALGAVADVRLTVFPDLWTVGSWLEKSSPSVVGRSGTEPHGEGAAWTCRVQPLVVFIRMPNGTDRRCHQARRRCPGRPTSVCRVVEECVR
jgi:hypothetical protein